jgi:hypothetical protein
MRARGAAAVTHPDTRQHAARQRAHVAHVSPSRSRVTRHLSDALEESERCYQEAPRAPLAARRVRVVPRQVTVRTRVATDLLTSPTPGAENDLERPVTTI